MANSFAGSLNQLSADLPIVCDGQPRLWSALDMPKPKTIKEYIQAAAPEARPLLQQMLEILRAAVPDATESIKWSEPAFSMNRILFMFSAHKRHIAFAPTPAVIQAFEDRLGEIETTKSTVKFAIGKPLPVKLIADMAALRCRDVMDNDARWM